MAKYFLYRISAEYDGFLPSVIPERVQRGMLRYNWGAYLESVEKGDVILTYFRGTGCREGIFLVSVVRQVYPNLTSRNVVARVLHFNAANRSPLVAVRDHRALFDAIRTRPRGQRSSFHIRLKRMFSVYWGNIPT
jgi:hypothetical protein